MREGQVLSAGLKHCEECAHSLPDEPRIGIISSQNTVKHSIHPQTEETSMGIMSRLETVKQGSYLLADESRVSVVSRLT